MTADQWTKPYGPMSLLMRGLDVWSQRAIAEHVGRVPVRVTKEWRQALRRKGFQCGKA